MAKGRAVGRTKRTYGTVITYIPPGEDPPVGDKKDDRPVPRARPTRRTVREPRDIVLNISASGLERDIPLGRCIQGCKWIYAETFGSGLVFYGVAALGEGPIRKAIPRADGVRLTLVSGSETNPAGAEYQSANGKIRVWVYDGSQSNVQETLSGLNLLDATWITSGADSPYNYLAFAVIKVTFQLNVQTGLPSFDFELEGNCDLYDSTTATRVYSENRAIWIREVLTNTRWGLKWPTASINDTDWIEAVNDCRQSVFPAQPGAAPTCAAGAAGVLNAGYFYKFTRVRNGVETLPSPVSLPITPANQQVNVTVPTGDSLTDEYYIYRSANPELGAPYRRVGTLAGNTGGVFADNMSDATWASQPEEPTHAPLTPYRYEGGGLLISRQANGRDWLNTLRAECLGLLTWNDGKLSLKINKALPGGYVMKTYSESTNVDPESAEWSRRETQDIPNVVEVRFTDIQNGYQTASVVKSRAGVTAGTEIPRRAVYELRGIGDSAYAGRIATQLLNLSWDDAEGSFRTNRTAIESLPWDVAEFTGGGLSAQPVRIRRIRSDDEDFVISWTEYQASSYSDEVVEEDAPVSVEVTSALDPYADPPNVDAGTVTWTEAAYQNQDLTGGTRATLSLTIPDTPFFEAVAVYVSINGGASTHWFDMPTSSIVTPPLYELGTYTLTFKVRTTTKRLSSGSSLAVPVVGVTGLPQPPDEFLGDATSGFYWNAPPATRSEVTLTSGMFTGTNMTTFVAANLVDDNESTTAAQFGAAGGTRSITVDLGVSPASVAEFEWVLGSAIGSLFTDWGISAGEGSLSAITFAYADNPAGPWTTVSYSTTGMSGPRAVDRNFKTFTWPIPAAQRGHRYIKWETTSAYTPNIAEIRAYTVSGTYDKVAGYKLTAFIGRDPGGVVQFHERQIAQPTSSSRLSYTENSLVVRDVDSLLGGYQQGTHVMAIIVQTVSSSGALSAGRMLLRRLLSVAAPANATGIEQSWVPQTQNSITIANGLNSNIAITLGPGAQELTGPTAAATLGGFVAPATKAAYMVMRYAGSQQITISNENASSTAANRIVTLTSADVVSRGAFVATFFYDRTAARWVLVAFNDGGFALRRSENNNTVALVQNSDAAGASAAGVLQSRADVAVTSLIAHGSGRTLVRFGVTIAQWSEMLNAGGLGLILGTLGATPLILGTNSTRAIEISGSTQVTDILKLKVGSGSATITGILSGSKTWDPPSIAAGDYTTDDVTVTGAAVGDKVIGVSHTANTTGAISFTGHVISANTVRVIAMNPSLAGAVNLASGTLSVLVVAHT